MAPHAGRREAPRRPGAATARAVAFVAARRDEALAAGRRAGELANDPRALATSLGEAVAALADPEYADGQRFVAPGITGIVGVRRPLLTAVARGLASRTRRDSSSTLLDVTEQLLGDGILELHWLAFTLLQRVISREPERAWQQVRAEAMRAGDWITVDSLAHVTARGVIDEPRRWAELEQLVYSPSPWERRLVGSTIATVPSVDRVAGRTPAIAARALAITAELVGDREPVVQKSLSWALRSLARVDLTATTDWLRREARVAREDGDGHRAWVVRDALGALPPGPAAELRDLLATVRRRPGAISTSRAAAAAEAFAGFGVEIAPRDRRQVPRTNGTGRADPRLVPTPAGAADTTERRRAVT